MENNLSQCPQYGSPQVKKRELVEDKLTSSLPSSASGSREDVNKTEVLVVEVFCPYCKSESLAKWGFVADKQGQIYRCRVCHRRFRGENSTNQRPHYSSKVKNQALELARAEVPVRQIATDLNVPKHTLCRWVREEKRGDNALLHQPSTKRVV